MTKQTLNTREIVLEGLLAVLEKGQYEHIVMGQILNKYSYFTKQDRAFITRLMAGTTEKAYLLDYIIDCHSNTKTIKMKPVIRTILRMSVYQIYFMDGVKDFAAINEAVNLAKKKGFKNLSGFVNGVLRAAAGAAPEFKLPDEPWLKYSVPEWLYGRLAGQYGAAKTEAILSGFERQDGVTVRMNLSRGKSAEEIMSSLKEQGIGFKRFKELNEALILTDFDNLPEIKMFKAGYIQVQDISSMFAAHAACVKSGDKVIDVCAAPGGKSLHIADMLMGTGLVEARDKSEYKLGLIKENLDRTGFKNMTAKGWDALVFDEEAAEAADIVIADLPCSGLGVLGKKPDIRYRIREEDIEALSKLQRDILSVACRYVKKGGALIYSTCTITREENEDNVKWFTDNFPFAAEGFDIGIASKKEEAAAGSVKLLPTRNTDGFFIARLKRID